MPSPLMMALSSRYTSLPSCEQVTSGRFGSSLPASTSSWSQRVAWNCSARIWIGLLVALPQPLLVLDAGGQRHVLVPGAGGAVAGAGGGAGLGLGAGCSGKGRGWGAGAPSAGGRRCRCLARGQCRAVSAPGGSPGMPAPGGRPPGGAPGGAACSAGAAPSAGIAWITGRMYRRAVWPRLRASLLSLPGTVITRFCPSMITSEPDTPRPSTRALMICWAWFSASRVGGDPSGRAGGQRDAGAALQVDAEFGVGLLVPGQEHQQVCTDQHRQEQGQVAGSMHRRRRRCHVFTVSSRSVRQNSATGAVTAKGTCCS